jgi:hypothetical protein
MAVCVSGYFHRLLMVSLSDHVVVGLSKEVVDILIELFSFTVITYMFLVFLIDNIRTSHLIVASLLSTTMRR